MNEQQKKKTRSYLGKRIFYIVLFLFLCLLAIAFFVFYEAIFATVHTDSTTLTK